MGGEFLEAHQRRPRVKVVEENIRVVHHFFDGSLMVSEIVSVLEWAIEMFRLPLLMTLVTEKQMRQRL